MTVADRTVVFAIPADTLWLDADGVGAMLGYDGRVTREKIAVRPGFPRPVRIGGNGQPRWNAREVHEWMLRERERTGGRPRAA